MKMILVGGTGGTNVADSLLIASHQKNINTIFPKTI